MMRYVEYAYLVAMAGIAGFMVMEFKDLEIGGKVMMSFAVMLCAFMYTFRRKQRLMLEEMDREHGDEETDAESTEDKTGSDGN